MVNTSPHCYCTLMSTCLLHFYPIHSAVLPVLDSFCSPHLLCINVLSLPLHNMSISFDHLHPVPIFFFNLHLVFYLFAILLYCLVFFLFICILSHLCYLYCLAISIIHHHPLFDLISPDFSHLHISKLS